MIVMDGWGSKFKSAAKVVGKVAYKVGGGAATKLADQYTGGVASEVLKAAKGGKKKPAPKKAPQGWWAKLMAALGFGPKSTAGFGATPGGYGGQRRAVAAGKHRDGYPGGEGMM